MGSQADLPQVDPSLDLAGHSLAQGGLVAAGPAYDPQGGRGPGALHRGLVARLHVGRPDCYHVRLNQLLLKIK